MNSRFCLIVLLFALLSPPTPVFAQSLSGATDAGRLEERAEPDATIPPNVTKDTYQPEDLPEYTPPQEGFPLITIQVEGATAFPLEMLVSFWEPYLGKKADITTLNHITALITRHYHQNGYILTKVLVPEQQVEDGRVTLRVIEGFAAETQVEYDDTLKTTPVAQGIAEQVSHTIRSMPILHGPTLEREILLLDDIPGITAQAIIAPASQTTKQHPGAVSITLKISQEKRLSGSVTVNNYGSRYTGPWQTIAQATANRIFSGVDELSVIGITSVPLDETQYAGVDYRTALNAKGTYLTASASYSSSEPGYTLKSRDVASESYSTAIGIEQALLRSRDKNIYAGATLDARNAATDVLGEELYDDRIRALRLFTRFDHADNYGGINAGSLTFSHGLDWLGAKSAAEGDLSRSDGESDFKKIEASLSRWQAITQNWQGYASLSGQYAWDPLLSSEEAGYGGQQFGPAYDPSEILGDHGISAAIELRYNGLPQAAGASLQPFIFYDIGKVWNINGTNAENISASSAGAGIRAQHRSGTSAELTVAVPVSKEADTPLYGNGDGPRFLFQLMREF